MRILRNLGLGLLAAVAVSLCFAAPRHALADAVNTTVGATGAAAPTLAIQSAGAGFNGTLAVPRICDKVAQVNATIAGGTAAIQLVAGVTSQNIWICDYSLAVSTAVAGTAVNFSEGTGSNCASGASTVSAALITTPTAAPTSPNVTFTPVPFGLRFTSTAGDALCLTQTTTTNASTITGWIHYTQG